MLWLVLLGHGVALLLLSPRSRDTEGFYWGDDDTLSPVPEVR